MNVSKRLGGAVYVVPNLITTGNLLFGFLCIYRALQGEFIYASYCILFAAICDILDGRVARLTRGNSEFGVQYDSLCDLSSFGIAPALLAYLFALQDFGRFGIMVCFFFVACGALRLARFNVQSAIGKASGDFTGLPIPMAALTIATFVIATKNVGTENTPNWFGMIFEFLGSSPVKTYVTLGLVIFTALMMVSSIRYRSHKTFHIKLLKPFKALVVSVVFLIALFYAPGQFGFIFVSLYALSALVDWMLGWKKPVADEEIFVPTTEDEDADGSSNSAN